MRLGPKTLLTVLAIVASCFTILWLVVETLVVEGYDAAEQERARADAKAVEHVFAALASSFRNSAEDWAIWTELVEFARTRDPAFLEENAMPDAFQSKLWTHMAIVTSPERDRAFSGALSAEGTVVKPTAEFDRLLGAGLVLDPDAERPIDGYAMLDGALHIVTSQPIRKSDGSVGSVRGAFVTARRIDDAWLARVSDLTSLDLRVRPLDGDGETRAALAALVGGADVHLAEMSETSLVSTTLLRDFQGAPLALLEVTRPRPVLAAGEQTAEWLGLGLAVAAVAFAGLALLFVELVVLRRVNALRRAIGALDQSGASHAGLLSRDELGELARGFDGMARAVALRGLDLERATRLAEGMRDNCGEGLVLCDVDGTIEGAVSAPVRAWFGEPTATITQYLGAGDRGAALGLELGFEQIRDGFLPHEVLLGQLPKRVARDGRAFQLGYRAITSEDVIVSVLIVIVDVTDRVALESRQAVALELQQVLSRALGDPRELRTFLRDAEALVGEACAATDMGERKRALHTLKGNAGMFGFQSIASTVHAIEDELAVGATWRPEHETRLRTVWSEALARVRSEDVLAAVDEIEISNEEQGALFDALTEHRALREVVASWRGTPAASYLSKLARHARIVSTRSGTPVEVEIECEPIRMESDVVGGVFCRLMGLVENAIEHGLEPETEREAQGKPPVGKVRIACALRERFVTVSISDDGRGFDWDATRARSPGMRRLLDELGHLGGTLRVDSKAGAGTTITLRFPARTASGRTIATTLPGGAPARAA